MKRMFFIALLILSVGVGILIGVYLKSLTPHTPTAEETTETSISEGGIPIEDYVSYNLSTLSPKKEELGGTFFVTSITAVDGTGTVSYEDGHSAYTADFTYEISSTGIPSVTSFVIRP